MILMGSFPMSREAPRPIRDIVVTFSLLDFFPALRMLREHFGAL
jgi:hypothetical protein